MPSGSPFCKAFPLTVDTCIDWSVESHMWNPHERPREHSITFAFTEMHTQSLSSVCCDFLHLLAIYASFSIGLLLASFDHNPRDDESIGLLVIRTRLTILCLKLAYFVQHNR
jgi:hypothetical protein